jgi:polyisoprenoid-binding protein YceI
MSDTSTAANRVYGIDASHSTVEFTVRHLMIAKVRGRFTGVAGTVEVPADGHLPVSIEATIDTSTITTGEAQRDAHLKSADFFDAEKYPSMQFASTQIVATGDGFDLRGDLTLHGVTLPVLLNATFEGETVDPWGNARYGYEAHGKISRKDFGLVWNQALEAGGVAVGDEVKIELSIEAVAHK